MAEAKGFLAAHDHLNAPDEVDQEAGPGTQTRCRVCFRSDGRDLISPCKCEGSSKFVHRECLDYHRTVKESFAFANCTDCKAPYYLRVHVHPERKGRILKFLKFRNILCAFAVIQIAICSLASVLYLVCGNGIYFGSLNYFYGGVFDSYVYYPLLLERVSATKLNVYYSLGLLLCCLLLGLSRFLMSCYNLGKLLGKAQSYQDLYILCKRSWWSISTKAFYYGFMAEADQTWLELMFIMELVVIGLVSFIGLLYAIAIASIFGRQIWKYHYYTFGKRLLTREYIVDDMDGLAKDWRPPPLPPDHVDELEELGFL
ncbi:uncharacterized protein LOC122020273 isoform X2 [Zingiber officinale]|uniref:uncharacterized protein LOC122020273 isoform X2 n=1 Tax=Zingiber officinale TaxID=94328 RepID=UPI001C4A9209|nr:uncharacterized protein LOC122020273 isoform X2 [Zingiber officinale]